MAILIGMAGGFILFFIYYGLYAYYPDSLPTTYVQQIIGKFFGKVLGFLYLLFFLYLTARVLRDFGEMLAIVGYPNTPIAVNQMLLLLVVIYTVNKGIEVLARTGEIFFIFIYLLAITGFVLIVFSGLIQFDQLRPVLEHGLLPVAKVAMTQNIHFPFGEIIAFSMIFPYVNHPEKLKTTALFALGLSGMNLAISAAVNISVLGVSYVSRTQFPLLATVQAIELAHFLERLDIFFMLAMIILGFFKISIYFYVVVIGTADLFHIKQPSRLSMPIGFVVLFYSLVIASNISEHLEEGLKIVPVFLKLPFQIMIPIMLLVIAFFKNRKGKGR
jgi:spore germination protein KB